MVIGMGIITILITKVEEEAVLCPNSMMFLVEEKTQVLQTIEKKYIPSFCHQ